MITYFTITIETMYRGGTGGVAENKYALEYF